MRQHVPRIELDTPIVPSAIAAAVLEEAGVWLGQPLPPAPRPAPDYAFAAAAHFPFP